MSQKQPDLKSYFDSFKVNPPRVDKNSDSLKEEDFYYKGDLSNIDDWLKHEEFRINRNNEKSERDLREENAKKAYCIAIVWALFIAVLIILYGYSNITKFNLSETEFLFVCGSLTASVLVFYSTVIRNLFPRRDKNI